MADASMYTTMQPLAVLAVLVAEDEHRLTYSTQPISRFRGRLPRYAPRYARFHVPLILVAKYSDGASVAWE